MQSSKEVRYCIHTLLFLFIFYVAIHSFNHLHVFLILCVLLLSSFIFYIVIHSFNHSYLFLILCVLLLVVFLFLFYSYLYSYY